MSNKKVIQLRDAHDTIEISGDHLGINMMTGPCFDRRVTTLRAEQAKELAAALLEYASKIKFR
jgi:hypothetical protein